MNTTYRIDPPDDYRPRHRKQLTRQQEGFRACVMVFGGMLVATAATWGIGLSGVIR